MAKKAKKTAASSMREAAKKRASERQNTGGGGTKFNFPDGVKVTFFKPEKGTMKLDILPYEVTAENHPVVAAGDRWYQRTIFTHNGIGAEEKSYLCLKTIGKKCPICEVRAKMVKSPDGDEDIIKSLTPKEREVFNVIDLNDEKAGVQLWEYSYHLFGKLLETELREGDDDLAGFADLVDGKTLKVRFKEKQMGKNKFLEADRIDFLDRDDYDEDILEDVLDLDAILNVFPYEKLDAIFTEMEDDEEEDEKPKKGKASKGKKEEPEDDEEEEEEKPKRGRASSKKSSKDEEEDDEEEEEKPKRGSKASKKPVKKEEEEDEEEEDEKPTRASKGKSKAKKEEPEDDEEEEEEEKPKKGKGKAKKEEPEDDEEECPVDDGTFGKDCDEYEECIDCEFFEACQEKHDELKAAAKKKRK